MNNRKYFAFISYKRKGVDEKVANWIDSKLEKYPYPKEYVSEENRPEDDTMIRKIFIDTKELPVTEEKFEDKIYYLLFNKIPLCGILSLWQPGRPCWLQPIYPLWQFNIIDILARYIHTANMADTFNTV